MVSPEPKLQRKLIKDRTLESFARNWTEKAGRQGSISEPLVEANGSTSSSGLLAFLELLQPTIHYLPTHKGSVHLHVFNGGWRNFEDVVAQDHKVCQLTGGN